MHKPILSTVSRAERPKPLIIEESETNMTEIKVVGVVGSGQMGSGIAQLAAVHGLDVWLLDTDPAALSRATKSITSNIHRLISKGQLSQVIFDPKNKRNEEKTKTLCCYSSSSITFSTELVVYM